MESKTPSYLGCAVPPEFLRRFQALAFAYGIRSRVLITAEIGLGMDRLEKTMSKDQQKAYAAFLSLKRPEPKKKVGKK